MATVNVQLPVTHIRTVKLKCAKEKSEESSQSRCAFPYSEDNLHDAEFVTTLPRNIIENEIETKHAEPQYNRFPQVSSYTNISCLSAQYKEITDGVHRYKLSIDTHLRDVDEYMDTTQDADITCLGKDIANCIGLQRIITMLSFYSTNCNYNNAESINTYLSKYNMRKHLVNDYHHLLDKHLNSHNHSARKCEKQFSKIYKRMMDEKHLFCNIATCEIWRRNNREREINPILSGGDDGDDGDGDETKVSMFMDLLDSIHCYFMHSVDIGHRTIDYNEDEDDNDEKDNDNNNNDLNACFDLKMSNLRRYLAPKQIKKAKRMRMYRTINGTGRFTTKILAKRMNMSGYLRKESLYLKQLRQRYIVLLNGDLYSYKTDKELELTECIELRHYEHVQISENGPCGQFELTAKDDSNHNKRVFIASNTKELDEWLHALKENLICIPSSDAYAFGERFDYWSTDSIYPKYKSIKEEITSNKEYAVSMDAFTAAFNKAIHLRNCTKMRNMMTCNQVTDIYNLRFDATPRIDHILAVVLWSDYRLLSAAFRSTFSSISKKIYDEFWILSKFLIECVNAFGERVKKSKNKMFYHVIECSKPYVEFENMFNAPTSSTANFKIALLNAPKSDGIVLEFTNFKRLRYFNCSFVSYCGNEDETLFIQPPIMDSNYQCNVLSMRNMETNENYAQYIKAMTILNKLTMKESHSHSHAQSDNISDECSDNIDYIVCVLSSQSEHDYDDVIPRYILSALRQWSDSKTHIIFDQKTAPNVDLYDKNIECLVQFDKLNIMFKRIRSISISIPMRIESIMDCKFMKCCAMMLRNINALNYSILNEIRITFSGEDDDDDDDEDDNNEDPIKYEYVITGEKWNISYCETQQTLEITRSDTLNTQELQL